MNIKILNETIKILFTQNLLTYHKNIHSLCTHTHTHNYRFSRLEEVMESTRHGTSWDGQCWIDRATLRWCDAKLGEIWASWSSQGLLFSGSSDSVGVCGEGALAHLKLYTTLEQKVLSDPETSISPKGRKIGFFHHYLFASLLQRNIILSIYRRHTALGLDFLHEYAAKGYQGRSSAVWRVLVLYMWL